MNAQVRWNLVVYEFLDNDQFSNLDTLMLQLAPGHCLLTLDADAIKGKPRGDMAKVGHTPHTPFNSVLLYYSND